MTATLTPNREAALAAMWWLFEGAVFYTFLANTSGAASPPAQTDNYTLGRHTFCQMNLIRSQLVELLPITAH